ncbi:epoxide hydrolase family protein [Pseudonocardia charpentierae]|uniref:Epoxide hydrolase n=1 Tax=Pseudonocardia charpentierae TaxID=3075545 RepID=A0ABU2NJ11_9PSEU|nr:epoxide hydrolase [Pseudonocardia sp. DSM 45834]MDT0353398.1 epoxide hydrolase [Pseudonocardia sp. DSM 45834]
MTIDLPNDTTFVLDVPQDVLDELHQRLARTRFPDAVADDWQRGTAPSALRKLVEHWSTGYDWRAAEARINALDHHRTTVDGVGLHHLRAGTPGRPPLLLVHGWPDSFLRFEDLIPLLADDFELVIPSIPGYGLSDRPTQPGTNPARIADLFAALMSTLGHDRFAFHGGDLGSWIGEQLAFRHPERLTALHLTDVPYWHLFGADPATLSPAEQDFLRRGQQWSQQEGAYVMVQGTKPQTLATALNDSPAGLAAWFLEKFRAWSDCGGDVWSRFTPDRLLTNLTLYWVTETAGSAARLYQEMMSAIGGSDTPNAPVTVPTAVAIFPADIVTAPREFAERWFDLRRWTAMPRGGHFAAWEEPELLAADLRAFLLPPS